MARHGARIKRNIAQESTRAEEIADGVNLFKTFPLGDQVKAALQEGGEWYHLELQNEQGAPMGGIKFYMQYEKDVAREAIRQVISDLKTNKDEFSPEDRNHIVRYLMMCVDDNGWLENHQAANDYTDMVFDLWQNEDIGTLKAVDSTDFMKVFSSALIIAKNKNLPTMYEAEDRKDLQGNLKQYALRIAKGGIAIKSAQEYLVLDVINEHFSDEEIKENSAYIQSAFLDEYKRNLDPDAIDAVEETPQHLTDTFAYWNNHAAREEIFTNLTHAPFFNAMDYHMEYSRIAPGNGLVLAVELPDDVKAKLPYHDETFVTDAARKCHGEEKIAKMLAL